MSRNGKHLPISRVGSNSFQSPLYTYKLLHLQPILNFPFIVKNHLRLSQFAQNNDAFYEFHHFHCFVKNPQTSAILLKVNFTMAFMLLTWILLRHPIYSIQLSHFLLLRQ